MLCGCRVDPWAQASSQWPMYPGPAGAQLVCEPHWGADTGLEVPGSEMIRSGCEPWAWICVHCLLFPAVRKWVYFGVRVYFVFTQFACPAGLLPGSHIPVSAPRPGLSGAAPRSAGAKSARGPPVLPFTALP